MFKLLSMVSVLVKAIISWMPDRWRGLGREPPNSSSKISAIPIKVLSVLGCMVANGKKKQIKLMRRKTEITALIIKAGLLKVVLEIVICTPCAVVVCPSWKDESRPKNMQM